MAVEHDDALLAVFRDVVVEADPVPASVLRAAVGCYTWRTVDAELAELVADSTEQVGALVRSAATEPRLLTFEADEVCVEVELSDTAAGARRVVGQVVPPGPARVTLQSPGAELGVCVAVDADELGRFAADAVPAGQLRLCIEREGHPAVYTCWTAV